MRKLVLALFLSFCPSLVLAQKVFVFPANGPGMNETDLVVITQLLKNAVPRVEGHRTVEDRAAAELSLRVFALPLGGSGGTPHAGPLVVTVVKEDASGRQYTVEAKSRGLSEMDVVARKLVRASLTEQDLGAVAGLDEITGDEETQGQRRVQAVRQFQFGFGPAVASGLNVNALGTLGLFGISWGLDPKSALDLTYELFLARDQGDARAHNLALGYTYFYSPTRHSPLLTLDFGYGWASAADGCPKGGLFCQRLSDDTANGWAVGGGVGYRFFRTSDVNVSVVLKSNYLFATTSKGHPSVTSLRLVLSY